MQWCHPVVHRYTTLHPPFSKTKQQNRGTLAPKENIHKSSLLGLWILLPNLETRGVKAEVEPRNACPVKLRSFPEAMRFSGLGPFELLQVLWAWLPVLPWGCQMGWWCVLQDFPSLAPGASGCAGVRPSASRLHMSGGIELAP